MAAQFELDPDSVADLVEAVIDTYDWTLPGEAGQSLGRDLAVTVADGMAERSNRGLGVDGSPLKANEPKYARYKLARYGVDRPGELSGQTFSLLSMLGTVEVGPADVAMSYGLGTPPTRATSRTGQAMRPWELKATDREKAGYLGDSGRDFYGLDEDIKAKVVAQAGERFLRHLTDAGLL